MSVCDSGFFASTIQSLIYKLVRSFEVCDEMCLAEHGVTATQSYTLLALPKGESINMNALSEMMGLANSTMTRMVDTLVRKGLVYRRHDEEDRRVVLVGLTSQGKEMQDILERERQLLLQEALVGIHEDERHLILSALEKVTRAFEKAMEMCKTGCSK